jgi:hypothetical protein
MYRFRYMYWCTCTGVFLIALLGQRRAEYALHDVLARILIPLLGGQRAEHNPQVARVFLPFPERKRTEYTLQ